MGALTLKSFPFELRGWDIGKLESIDPTDGFGSNTKIYISKNQIILIEPDSTNTPNTWITDKSRQFFDSIFGTWDRNKNNLNTKKVKKNVDSIIIRSILESIYVFEHCNKRVLNEKKFYIVFENLSIEILNILLILSHNFNFISLKRAENKQLENDLEIKFQLNASCNKINLKFSTFCFIIANNPRYEGFYLNLNLRQRFLKGNFKCALMGSLISLSFPVSFLGSNLNILKSITEGNSITCQNFKSAKNPILIYNSELFKRNDSNNVFQMINNLNSFSTLNFSWNGLNMLSSSLGENSTNNLSKFQILNTKNLSNFSLLYFINIQSNSVPNLKKITELKLLNYTLYRNFIVSSRLTVDQNYKYSHNKFLFDKILSKGNDKNLGCYQYIPSTVFYENEETFISTEGFFKRTVKVITNKNTTNNWQIIRKIIRNLKKNLISLNKKNNEIIFFNSNRLVNFKNFIFFQFYAIQNLNSLNFYLTIKTNPAFFNKKYLKFKIASKKSKSTKTKYWLDDFFANGKDEYSQQSLILASCSKLIRFEETNFF